MSVSANRNRKNFNTTLNMDLYKRIKFLALKLEKNANDLLEEGMSWMLKLHGEESFTQEDLERLKRAVKEAEDK